jgi:hypothetical protein
MKCISVIFGAVVLVTSVCCQATEWSPVSARQVAHSLAEQGLPLSEDKITLSAQVLASSEVPSFDVVTSELLAERSQGASRHARLRLACQQPARCLPFFITVALPEGAELPVTHTAGMQRRADEVISMKAGSRATLLISTLQMHIRIPVVSLQSGAVGAAIHVASLDRKQTYTAIVVSPTVLTGEM